MADEGISTKVSVLGDKEYKASLADIGRQLTLLNTDMGATQSAFGEQADSMDAVKAKGDSLRAIYEAQAEKVRVIAEQLAKANAEYGENSKQADTLEIALNRAKTAMNKAGTEIAANDQKLTGLKDATEGAAEGQGTLDKQTGKAADAVKKEGEAAGRAEGENSRLKDALQKAGSVAGGALKVGVEAAAAAMAAMAAAAAAAVTAGFNMAKGAGTYADDLLTLSSQTSVSADSLQKWGYAANFLDTDVSVMTGSMAKMVRTVGQANNGSDAAKDKFKALGISIKDGSGQLKSSEQLFSEAIDALGKVGNETERDALAMDLFGKSAQELNPLIEAGGQALTDLGKEAESMGVVFSSGALSAMGSFDDSMQKVGATGEALKNSIGLVLIPAFQPLMDTASATMAEVAKALQDGIQPGEMESIFGKIITGLETSLDGIGGIIDGALPMVTEGLSSLIGIVVKKLPTFMKKLVPAAAKLLQGLLDAIVQNIGPIAKGIAELVKTMATFLINNIPLLLDAAWQIVVAIAEALLDIDMSGFVEGIGAWFTQAWEGAQKVFAGVGDFFAGIWDAIVQAFVAVGDWFAGIFSGAWTAVKGAFSGVMTWAAGVWQSIKDGFGAAVDAVKTWFGEKFAAAWTAVKDAFTGVAAWAAGVWQSIKDGFGAAVDAVKTWFGEKFAAAWTAVKEAFTGVAAWAAGVWQNIKDGFGAAVDAVKTWFSEKFAAAWTAVKDAFTGVADWAAGVWQSIKDGFGAAVDAVKGWFSEKFGGAWSAVKDAFIGVTTWAGGVWTDIQNGFGTAVDAVKTWFGGKFGDAWTAVKGAFTGVTDWAGGVWESIKGGFASVTAWFSDLFGGAWNTLKGVFGAGSEKVLKDAERFLSSTENAYNSRGGELGIEVNPVANPTSIDAFNKTIQGLYAAGDLDQWYNTEFAEVIAVVETGTGKVKGMLETLKSDTETLLSLTNGLDLGLHYISGLMQGMQRGFQAGQVSVLGAAAALAGAAMGALWGAVGPGGSKFQDIGEAIAQGVAEGIRKGSVNIRAAAVNAARVAYKAATDELQIKSPSKKMEKVGEQYDAGLAGGIDKGMQQVLKSARGLSDRVAREISTGGSGRELSIDYEKLGEAVARANQRAGLGKQQIYMDSRLVGETVEPSVSRASYGRAKTSISGRAARLAMG